MIIKVCGMRDALNIREVCQLDINWMGFIFVENSPRYVSQITSLAGIIPDFSAYIDKQGHDTLQAHNDIKRVGVFKDEMPQTIITRVVNFKLDIVQLHGDESPVMIDNLRRTLVPDICKDIKIMKALPISDAADMERWKPYEGHADYLLFDTKTATGGGSGRKFNWALLDNYHGTLPFLLSGGIGPDDAEAIKAIRHPQFLGIDINSQFEKEPAIKDVAKLKEFISKLR
ncbi:MAG: phosphoribosylanthranilate isomerase [Prevotella sp.]|nr:phosphoribosylanthranilate isomerase [Prevotella sp.]MDY5257995.1 phosphoribosylanthranilate isomerase [Prevotella sp.]